MPDFLYRLETTINFLCNSIKAIQKEDYFEIIIVDWVSKEPLSQQLDIIKCSKKLLKFLYISEKDLITQILLLIEFLHHMQST